MQCAAKCKKWLDLTWRHARRDGQPQFLRRGRQGADSPLPIDELRAFTEVFGKIKSDYVEPVEDKKLITEAINGMLTGLDPHSAYLDAERSRICRSAPRVNSAAWASKSAWKTASSRWCPRSRIRPHSWPA